MGAKTSVAESVGLIFLQIRRFVKISLVHMGSYHTTNSMKMIDKIKTGCLLRGSRLKNIVPRYAKECLTGHRETTYHSLSCF